MTAVFLIRHPRTTWNEAGRYQGRLDAPLSEEGKRQIGAVAALFAGEPVSVVYSSPLTRSLSLAVSLSDELDAPLQTDERLAEIALGEWQGLYREQIRERFPDLFELWYSRPSLVHFPGGEALSDVLTRATEWLQSVLSRDPEGQNVIAVTHTSVIQVLAAAAIGLDLACLHRVHVDNCSVTTLVGSDAPGALVTLNDRRAITATPVAAASTQNLVSWMERRATY